MKELVLTLKGILFYTTIVAVVLYICCIDCLYTKGYFFSSTIFVAAMIYTCRKILNKEEVETFLMNKGSNN